MKQDYALFYVIGREERPFKNDIDTENIAKQVLKGEGSIITCTLAAVSSAASSLRVDRKKRMWLEEYADEIKTAGGDGEEAYKHYVDGRIETTTLDLEDEVFTYLSEIVAPDDEGDDDDEEEDDDAEEDED